MRQARGTLQRDRGAAGASREPLGADEQRDGLAAFDHARHPQPRGERKRPQRSGRARPPGRTRPGRSSPAWRTRFIALSAVSALEASPVPRTHSSRARSSPSAAPTPDRIDRPHRSAPLLRRAPPRRPARGTTASSAPPIGPRRSPTGARAAARRRAHRRWTVAGRARVLRLALPRRGRRQRDIQLAGTQQRFELGEGGHGRHVSLYLRLPPLSIKRPRHRGSRATRPIRVSVWITWVLR